MVRDPVYDIHRAAAGFYNAIYNMQMEMGATGSSRWRISRRRTVSAALVFGPGCLPNDTGTAGILNAGNDLDGVLGAWSWPRPRDREQDLDRRGAGWFALFIDSEGNRVALHEGPPWKCPSASSPPQTQARREEDPAEGGQEPAKRKR